MLTQAQLAAALGVSDRSIRLWVGEGMPTVGEGRGAVYDEGACRAWATRRGKKLAPPGGAQAAAPPVAAPLAQAAAELMAHHPRFEEPPPVGGRGDRLEEQPHGGALRRPGGRTLDGGNAVALAAELATLERADSTPVARATAALSAAAGALAAALRSKDGATGRDFDSFRGTLDGLRQAEAAYLDLERERGELIEREAARGCMGRLAHRFVLGLERLEVRVAAQVELWLADAAFRELSVDERARTVRAWVAAQTRQARVEQVEDLERLIAGEVEERKAR
ncbi:MAG: hypothetical protein KF878_00170 [Planctomycetes bacterium]|nr:hypothetical protein [Planctomycetota bacterium]